MHVWQKRVVWGRLGAIVSEKYIIIVPDPVVCLDLSGTLSVRAPDNAILVGSSLTDVASEVESADAATTLLAKGSLICPHNALNDALELAASRGARIVILGETRDVTFPAIFIDIPFTTDMISEALDRSDPHAPRAC